MVAEAKVKTDDGKEFFIGLLEVEGMPNFYMSDESYYDAALGNCSDDEEADFFQHTMLELCEYEELFEDPDAEWYDLYRYMIYIVRADWEECEEFMAATEGKYLDEIDIPVSDVEEDYLNDKLDGEES